MFYNSNDFVDLGADVNGNVADGDLAEVATEGRDIYCSTSRAAKMLGVSLGTVQQMVESGKLVAWKTAGGHRRIRLDSLQALLGQGGAAHAGRGETRLKVLVAEDDAILQTLYRRTLESWGLPLSLTVVDNGFDGLLEVGRDTPHVLIVDLAMPGMDGFEMVRAVRNHASFLDMDVIVVSAMSAEDIAARGGLPDDVTVYAKPVPFGELRGFFRARLTQLIKSVRPRPPAT